MKQPIFYPGKRLCAEDLIGLEEYAFSRVNIISPDHGVVSLYTHGVQPEQRPEGGLSVFTVKQVTGITPEGRPINFKAGSGRMVLKLPYPSSGVFVYDIYMDDVHPEKKDHADLNEEKYKLSYKDVSSQSTEPPVIVSNKLYLGRYKLEGNNPPFIVNPPYIYSLAAFNFPSEWWQNWTYPIREALRTVAEKHKSEYIMGYIKHILYNYPFMPISQLIKASKQLAWLCTETDLEDLLEEGSMIDLQQNQVSNPLPDVVYNIPPVDIPTKIGEILGSSFERLWKLIPQKQLSITEGTVRFDRPLIGKHEIKIKFKSGIERGYVEEFEKLRVDNFFDFVAPRFEEEDILNKKCYCYLIEYAGGYPNEKFTMTVPKRWNLQPFDIYYRTLIES